MVHWWRTNNQSRLLAVCTMVENRVSRTSKKSGVKYKWFTTTKVLQRIVRVGRENTI